MNTFSFRLISTGLILFAFSGCQTEPDIINTVMSKHEAYRINQEMAINSISLRFIIAAVDSLKGTIPAEISSKKITSKHGGSATYSGTSTTNGTTSTLILKSNLNKYSDSYGYITGTADDTIFVNSSTGAVTGGRIGNMLYSILNLIPGSFIGSIQYDDVFKSDTGRIGSKYTMKGKLTFDDTTENINVTASFSCGY